MQIFIWCKINNLEFLLKEKYLPSQFELFKIIYEVYF